MGDFLERLGLERDQKGGTARMRRRCYCKICTLGRNQKSHKTLVVKYRLIMKRQNVMILAKYVAASILCVGIVGFIIDRERSFAYSIGHAIFLGIVLGTVFYFIDKRKTVPKE